MNRHRLIRALAALVVPVTLTACGGAAPALLPVAPPIASAAPEPVVVPVAEVPAAEPAPAPLPPEPEPPTLTFPEEPFRAALPKAGAPRSLQQPKLVTFRLKNGIEVFLVERHELPTVTLDLVISGGQTTDAPGKPGTASLCSALLDDGTEKLAKLAFEEALADTASSVSSWAGADQHGVGMSALSRHLDATLALWADTLLHPGLRQEDHDRNVQQLIASLAQQVGSPAALGGRLYGRVFYGESHPLGQVTTAASAGTITREDCVAFAKERLAPEGAQLFVVGDVTRRQLEQALGARLGAWQGRATPGAALPAPTPTTARVVFVDVPGAAQSQLYVAHVGPARKAPDYHPTLLMTSILGGGFSSRINMNLREDKGWAYGARGGLRYLPAFSTFAASSSVRADVTAPAVAELFKEITAMKSGTRPLTDEELTREVNGLVRGLPGRFSTGGQIIGSFRELVYYGLPLDTWTSFQKQVGKVKRGDVELAAKTHLHPEDARVLVVGDGAKVLGPLRELLAAGTLGAGELIVMDPEGRLAP